MKVKHYLFTRFNLVFVKNENKPWAERVVDQGNLNRFSKIWWTERFRLFNKYCLPSVNSQTTKDFEWIIFVHKDSEQGYLDRLANHATLMKTDFPDFEAAPVYMKEGCKGYDFVITTNLDNDDAVSPSFLEEVRKEFRGEMEYLNVTEGFNLCDYPDNNVYVGKQKFSNPYRSLVEPVSDSMKSVYHITHGDSAKIAPVRQIGQNARWLQIIHGNNLSNRFKAYSNDKPANVNGLYEIFPFLENK